MNRYTIILIFIISVILNVNTGVCEAKVVQHVLNNPLSNVVLEENVKFNFSTGVPSGNCAITHLDLTVSHKKTVVPQIRGWLCAYYDDYTGAHGGGGDEPEMLFNLYQQPNYKRFVKNYNPAAGEAVANRRLHFRTGYDGWNLKIDKVIYNEYFWDNIYAEVTPEKYVKITMQRNESVPYTNISVKNTVTGDDIGYYSTGAKTTYTFMDDDVIPGKYYSYSISSGFGNSSNLKYIKTIGILVPSEATLAKIAAEEAKAAAENAYTKAEAAANNTSYKNQSSGYWSYNAYSKANTAANNTSYTRYTQLPDISTKIANLDTKITNVENTILTNDNTPPDIKKIEGLNGATCTTGSKFTLVISASDNGPASNLRYKAGNGSWGSSNKVTVTTSKTGANTVTVYVSDNPTSPDAGNISQMSFTYFKI